MQLGRRHFCRCLHRRARVLPTPSEARARRHETSGADDGGDQEEEAERGRRGKGCTSSARRRGTAKEELVESGQLQVLVRTNAARISSMAMIKGVEAFFWFGGMNFFLCLIICERARRLIQGHIVIHVQYPKENKLLQTPPHNAIPCKKSSSGINRQEQISPFSERSHPITHEQPPPPHGRHHGAVRAVAPELLSLRASSTRRSVSGAFARGPTRLQESA